MNIRRLSEERGQILAISAIMLTMLLGVVGLAIDTGFHVVERRQAQNGADEAAMAAAYELAYGSNSGAATTAALDIAEANGFDNNGTSNTVTVNIPPTEGEFVGNAEYVEVVIEKDPNTFFIHAVPGIGGGVAARGVATYVANEAYGDGYAIFVNHANCGTSDALEISGSVNDIVGLVHSNSVLKISGSDNSVDGGSTYTCSYTNSGSNNMFDPAPTQDAARPFPFTYTWDDICGQPGAHVHTSDLQPHIVYGNPIPDGIYCSTQKIDVGASGVSGNVTLAAQQEVVINGSNQNLTGYWNNILAFTSYCTSSALDMSGSDVVWTGILAAPCGKAKIQGSSNISIQGSILADTVSISGSDIDLSALQGSSNAGGPAVVILVE